MVLVEGYPWQTLNSQNSSSLFLVATDYKEKPPCARFVYRLGHCPFTAVRRGSIPPPSTRFNYIGLPKPVGGLGVQDTRRSVARQTTRKMETKPKGGYGGHAGESWIIM